MDIASLFLLALALSVDCFAVAVGGSLSMRRLYWRQILRVATVFGLFQAGMLVVGWLSGYTIAGFIEGYDHWVAFGLLVLVGVRIIRESLESDRDGATQTDITRGKALVFLSIATSIDSLAVGLGLGFVDGQLLLAALLIGGVTFAITVIGFMVGNRLGLAMGRWAGLVGGVVLIGIGFRILLPELLG